MKTQWATELQTGEFGRGPVSGLDNVASDYY